MATPITHLFFADEFWDKHQEIDRFQFFAGNSLPDIRYIDKTIERTKYHIKNLTIDNILEEKSDFWKGVKFHSFVDEDILCEYFSRQPCKDSRKSFILGIGLDKDICNKIEGMLGELYGKYIQEIEDMILFLENLMK